MKRLLVLAAVMTSLMLRGNLPAADILMQPAHADSGLAWYDAALIGVEGKG